MLQAIYQYRDTVVGGRLILAPRNIPGRFELDATSDLAARLVLTGSYEPEVTTALQRLSLPDGLIVNVGANVGLFAAFLAQTFPKASAVLAIEPNPEALALLVANTQRNELTHRIQIVQSCIGESEGEVELAYIKGKSEYSSVGAIAHPGVAGLQQHTARVPVTRLDSLTGSRKAALLFIDTEGAEYLVFKGATTVLTRDRPILFFECSDTLLRKFGSSTQQVEALLKSFGYDVCDALRPGNALRHPYEGEALAVHNGDQR
jgi:FkbM family methyltransferase